MGEEASQLKSSFSWQTTPYPILGSWKTHLGETCVESFSFRSQEKSTFLQIFLQNLSNASAFEIWICWIWNAVLISLHLKTIKPSWKKCREWWLMGPSFPVSRTLQLGNAQLKGRRNRSLRITLSGRSCWCEHVYFLTQTNKNTPNQINFPGCFLFSSRLQA